MIKGLAQVLFLAFLACHAHRKRSGEVGPSTQSDEPCVCMTIFRSRMSNFFFCCIIFGIFLVPHMHTGNGVVR